MYGVKNNDHLSKIDGIYFLENVPIQTFYIGYIPYKLNETNLNDYFLKFGEINSLIIPYRKFTRKPNRYGLITFKSPQSATRLIELGERHIVCKQIVSIKVAKVSNQPDWKEPENKQASIITLLDLNDDCLLHILCYLPIEDQVSFSFICERFRSVCQVIFKRTQRLILTDSIGPLNVDKILSTIGIYVKEIVFQCYNHPNRILNAVWRKCKNIEKLHVLDLCVPTYDYSKMFFALKNLKSLSLIDCNIDDDTCEILQNCNQIENLNLSLNYEISGAYLNKLTNLKKLNLSNTNIDSKYLISICQNAKLKELDIIECRHITENDLKQLFINLTDLENLAISTLRKVGSLTNELIKLKSLIHLKVYCFNYFDGDHLGDIKNLECLHLEHLTLCNCRFDIKRKNDIMFLKHLNCLSIPEFSGFDDFFFTDLIEKCPTIEEIDISEPFFDEDLVLEIIDKVLEIKRIKNLKLMLDLTCINIENIFGAHDKTILQKVVPVVGELSTPNLGFKDDLMKELTEKVNIIYHSAATIRFSSPLRTAIKTNLTGTMRTIEFAKSLKNLSAYVYLSTAFCNSNHRGYISETVYKSRYDPYEMMKMAEDDSQWEDYTLEKCREIIRDHPNTYTFTKNLAENLIVAEMSGLPAGIVRPSIVYGTWEHPVKGWVGNANSGHLGFLAGFVKGVFRTMSGNPSSPIDVIPCDYVINSSLVMGWYAGTRELAAPEIIHCTSGEVNLLTLDKFMKILNQSAKNHPSDYFVWKPKCNLRTGWRYTLFFYLFQIIPAMLILIPETIFNVGMTHHTLLEYMRVFDKGTKAFDYFLDKDFRYSLKNALRLMSVMNDDDKKRYNFDASQCNWSEFMDRCLIGVRHYYFKESPKTSRWHRIYWNIFEAWHYVGVFILLALIYALSIPLFGLKYRFALSFFVWTFLMWL